MGPTWPEASSERAAFLPTTRTKSPEAKVARVVWSGLCAVAIFASVALYVVVTDSNRWQPGLPLGLAENEKCKVNDAAPLTTAPKSNVWANIDADDNAAVWNFLHDPANGLNLTDPRHADINDNYVGMSIDKVPANKSDVIRYLDGSGPKPENYARVVIFEGGREEPVSQEYMVGPLPVSSWTTVRKLDYMYNGGMGGKVPFDGRKFDKKRIKSINNLVIGVMTEVADITSALASGAVYLGPNNPKTTVEPLLTSPTSMDGKKTLVIMDFTYPGQGMFSSQIDFYLVLDCSGTDASRFFLRGIVTQDRFFATAKDLRKAYEAGELKPADLVPDRDVNWTMLDYKKELGVRDLEDRFAPRTMELDGKRYRIDQAQRYVEYMGWSFYVAHSAFLGLMFFDIRFRGQRILYELSLQEALAQYSGGQPRAAGTVYHDTYFGLGNEMGVLVEGFDCPFGSTFWDLPRHEGNRSTTTRNAVCLFEADAGFPLSRHRSRNMSAAAMHDAPRQAGPYRMTNLGTVANAVLTVRAVATVGNYDYLFDYAFGLDGALEVTVRASGYLMSSPWYADHEGKWGPRIHRATQGSLHDHVMTFKADFDILDARNSLQVTKLELVNKSQPWFPDLGDFEQMQLNVTTQPVEAALDWGVNGQVAYSVVHADEKNAWGESRGYRILPGRGGAHLTADHSPFTTRNAAFARHALYVTRQHDDEVYANSIQNLNLAQHPQQDFAKFLNNESLDGEDLVVWFNLGMHHYTRAEDVPMTSLTQAVSSIVFAPENFFDRAQDGDLKNRRWVEMTGNRSHGGAALFSVEAYGIETPQCRVDLGDPGSIFAVV